MRLLSGPVLLGFARLFDRAHGDPTTPRPYPVITPSRIGAALLPYACPFCAAVHPETLGQKIGRKQSQSPYTDPVRGFSWCPSCGGRYVLDHEGIELGQSFSPSDGHAPARVREPDREWWTDSRLDGLDVLGCLS